MMEKFRQLAPREQLAIVIGGFLAMLIIGWSFIWAPLRDGVSARRDSVGERATQVVDLRRAAQLDAATGSADSAAIDSSSLVFLVDQTSRPMGLTFPRSSPDGPDAINITFRDERFDNLLDWIIDLEQTHGVGVVSASFTQGAGPGLVNGQLRLERV
jgi:type II secretory pathway component PulM